MAREGMWLVGIAVLGGVSYGLGQLRSASSLEAGASAAPAVAPKAQDTVAPAAAAVRSAPDPAASDDHRHELELPDGTFLPALNGAVAPAPLSRYWGAEVPWSPIVGVERSHAGVDWYRHANGSYSTTENVWRQDLGRFDAMTRVAHPGPAGPATAPRQPR